MPEFLTIIADDLTGAADTGVSLVALGAAVPLHLAIPRGEFQGAVDLNIRDAAIADAEKALALATRTGLRPREFRLFKIDSTLRGPVRQIAAAALRLGRPVVICPAFPEMGRTVESGRISIEGIPVEQTAFGRSQNLTREDLKVPGEPPADLALALCSEPRLIRVDAGSTEDLDEIARVAIAAALPPVLIGSGGMAKALLRGLTPNKQRPISKLVGPILWLAGSAAPILHAQVNALGDLPSPETAKPGSDALLASPPLISGTPLDPIYTRQLVARAASAARKYQTVFASGGATARRFLEALGVNEVRIVGEPIVGTVALETGLAAPRHVLVRSGGFGKMDDLVSLRDIIARPHF